MHGVAQVKEAWRGLRRLGAGGVARRQLHEVRLVVRDAAIAKRSLLKVPGGLPCGWLRGRDGPRRALGGE